MAFLLSEPIDEMETIEPRARREGRAKRRPGGARTLQEFIVSATCAQVSSLMGSNDVKWIPAI